MFIIYIIRCVLHCYVLWCCTFVTGQPLTLIKKMNWTELNWLKFTCKSPIHNRAVLDRIITWRQTVDKPSEQMISKLSKEYLRWKASVKLIGVRLICITRNIHQGEKWNILDYNVTKLRSLKQTLHYNSWICMSRKSLGVRLVSCKGLD